MGAMINLDLLHELDLAFQKGGWPNNELRQRVDRICLELKNASVAKQQLNEHLRHIRNWSGIIFSHHKFERFGGLRAAQFRVKKELIALRNFIEYSIIEEAEQG